MVFGTVIAGFDHFAHHTVGRNIEYSVKVQTVCRNPAFPCADMLPSLAAHEVFEGIAQGFGKTFLGMLLIGIGERAKIVSFLQVYFFGKQALHRL